MNKREVVRNALLFKEIPYVPWSFRFTVEAKKKLLPYTNGLDIEDFTENHFVELGAEIGIFEKAGDNLVKDVFGVIWDRSIEKDIGNVKVTVLPEPSLKNYSFPDPLDKRFFEDISYKTAKYNDRFRVFNISFSLYERACREVWKYCTQRDYNRSCRF